jgi:hypothetical protein
MVKEKQLGYKDFLVFFSLRLRDFRIYERTLLNQNKSSIFGKKNFELNPDSWSMN